jgi:four helix bundle protein
LNGAQRLNGWNDWNGYFAQREGVMRLGSKEYRQFIGIARGSAGEVCYQLLLAKDLKYITEDVYRELRSGYDRVIQMLSRLSETLNR